MEGTVLGPEMVAKEDIAPTFMDLNAKWRQMLDKCSQP